MLQAPEQLLRGLRAAADPSRIRLLALLALGEFAVSELTEILGQSQPRVSRHLRLMSEAGLLERFRELHWVYYRLAADGDGAQLARTLLERLDRDDPELVLDRDRAAAVRARRAEAADRAVAPLEAVAPVDGGELAQVTIAELGGHGFEALMYVGPAPTAMLQVLAPKARRVLGVSGCRAEVQRARASLHGRGLAHCVLQQGELPTVTAAATHFDVVVLDRLLGGHVRPGEAIAHAARVLRPGGRIAFIEDYEALASRTASGNPLAVLREWIEGSGLLCTRIRPVDMGTAHLLVVIATVEQGRLAA